ncbi:MAG: hypothetical protein IPI77_21780 [Saprospiraceae bacterium]|nr:hypothetical protein [Saprospiraceae bacterium]
MLVELNNEQCLPDLLFLKESGGHCSLRRSLMFTIKHTDIHHQDPEEVFIAFLMHEYGLTESGGHFSLRRVTDVYNQDADIHHRDKEFQPKGQIKQPI